MKQRNLLLSDIAMSTLDEIQMYATENLFKPFIEREVKRRQEEGKESCNTFEQAEKQIRQDQQDWMGIFKAPKRNDLYNINEYQNALREQTETEVLAQIDKLIDQFRNIIINTNGYSFIESSPEMNQGVVSFLTERDLMRNQSETPLFVRLVNECRERVMELAEKEEQKKNTEQADTILQELQEMYDDKPEKKQNEGKRRKKKNKKKKRNKKKPQVQNPEEEKKEDTKLEVEDLEEIILPPEEEKKEKSPSPSRLQNFFGTKEPAGSL